MMTFTIELTEETLSKLAEVWGDFAELTNTPHANHEGFKLAYKDLSIVTELFHEAFLEAGRRYEDQIDDEVDVTQ